jgi:death-on-curing protein
VSKKIKYISSSLVLKKHNIIIERSGGKSGILNKGSIDSILHHIRNDDYYPTFEDKLTHLVFSFNKNHCFNDGNKRTSILVGNIFLRFNDYGNYVDIFTAMMEEIAVAVADNAIDKDGLKRVVSAILRIENPRLRP